MHRLENVTVTFPYGKGFWPVAIPEKNLIEVLTLPEVSSAFDENEIIKNALAQPIGSPTLANIVKDNAKIAIIVTDITRPVPLDKILPLMLQEILQAGGKKENITIIFALGNHKAQTIDEQKAIVGVEIFNQFKCVDFNKNDTVLVGKTSFDTIVRVARDVYAADIKICIGNIEYHYFAGYTGGFKAILPGVCSPATITQNHSLMLQDGALMGNLAGNPVRMDLEEAGNLVGVNFILNVVLNENKKIVYAVAGDAVLAHRAGCKYVADYYQVKFSAQADIVIASAGGFPKDVNIYQAQKAMENARKVLKLGGTIILISKCQDGAGEGLFQQWMTNSDSAKDLIAKYSGHFALGGHKAIVIAKILAANDTYLISDLSKEITENYFFKYASSVQGAIAEIRIKKGIEPKILAMPYAHITVPMLKKFAPLT